ncbi:MAG: cellulase family glycosylhydrolase [Kitasatospora sp.]|jgi:endoglucanase|nr:cellulase family glycosylhydrolase [Kitasatospora sp.]
MKRLLVALLAAVGLLAGLTLSGASVALADTASNGYPYCASASSDPDGDGWGWENNASCVVRGGKADPAGTSSGTASNGYPYCVNGSATDPDGDGWGWENNKSCVVRGGKADPGSSTGGGTTPPASTPVAAHGQLHVCGTGLCDVHGAKVQLRGVSSMWLNWETQPYAENATALAWMRDNWHLQVIRAAMGVEPDGAYLSDPAKSRAQVEAVIDSAVKAGVYVIVDFHAHEAYKEQSQAVAFFADLAKRYGSLPNVIWEDWNEPLQVSWSGVLKPYHQAVVAAIRANDPDNVIVLGTSTWSQDVDVAAADPVSGSNLMYTLHFYSCSHGQALRDKADAALRAGLPIFVTEWGATNADGGLDGQVCGGEAQNWLTWMKNNNLSWSAWKLDVGTDASNLLAPGAPVTGGWDNYLHGHAPLVVAAMK